MAYPLDPAGDAITASDRTLKYYDREAVEYARATVSNDLSDIYPELLNRLPAGGLVLDAGSGSGRDVREFLARGFQVEALDASPRLAELATQLTGVPVEVVRLEDWSAPADRYHGVWCFASLLHVSRDDLPGVIHSLARSLKVGGWLFASFKRGSVDYVDQRGRHYTNMTETEARQLFGGYGLTVERVWHEAGLELNGRTTWVYVLARRSS